MGLFRSKFGTPETTEPAILSGKGKFFVLPIIKVVCLLDTAAANANSLLTQNPSMSSSYAKRPASLRNNNCRLRGAYVQVLLCERAAGEDSLTACPSQMDSRPVGHRCSLCCSHSRVVVRRPAPSRSASDTYVLWVTL